MNAALFTFASPSLPPSPRPDFCRSVQTHLINGSQLLKDGSRLSLLHLERSLSLSEMSVHFPRGLSWLWVRLIVPKLPPFKQKIRVTRHPFVQVVTQGMQEWALVVLA